MYGLQPFRCGAAKKSFFDLYFFASARETSIWFNDRESEELFIRAAARAIHIPHPVQREGTITTINAYTLQFTTRQALSLPVFLFNIFRTHPRRSTC